MIAIIAVSQPKGNSIMYNLTGSQAEEFLTEARYFNICSLFLRLLSKYSKHLEIFRDSAEYGWELKTLHTRRKIVIINRKFGTECSIKSYPSALHGDAKINSGVSIPMRKIYRAVYIYTHTLYCCYYHRPPFIIFPVH